MGQRPGRGKQDAHASETMFWLVDGVGVPKRGRGGVRRERPGGWLAIFGEPEVQEAIRRHGGRQMLNAAPVRRTQGQAVRSVLRQLAVDRR